MEHLNTSHFRNLCTKNVENLKNFCNEWDKKLSDSSIPEEVSDEIRTTIGLTNLLLSQKLKQFEGLIEDSELKRGEKEITCLDLQGFWDMVYNEVEKIEKKFSNLDKCQRNNWVFVQEDSVKIPPKKRFIPAVVKSSISAKKHASAAQQRLAEAKLKMRGQIALQKENTLKKKESNVIKDAKNVIREKKDTVVEFNSVPDHADQQNSKLSTKINAPSGKVLSSKHKTRNKTEKENVLPQHTTESEEKPTTKKRKEKAKEVIPLQCVTRSARRAMMAKQTETKKD